MPVIRIDDDVFQALQSGAKPFVDTPNSVLRRLLGIDVLEEGRRSEELSSANHRSVSEGATKSLIDSSEDEDSVPESSRRKYERASAGELLPQQEYFDPILQTLYELGGSANSRRVIDQLFAKNT